MDRPNHRLLVFLVLPFLLAISAPVRCHGAECVPGTIHTIAGGGTSGPATEMCLYAPSDVAIGSDGLYIADLQNYVIRRLGLDGMLTTVAGDGWTDSGYIGRFAGDGGPALRASFEGPDALAVGPDGSFYITEGHRVRRISPAGIITTLAGTGDAGYAGDGGPAIKAMLKAPSDVAVGKDGSVYIADTQNHRIRKVDPDGTISTFAGDGRRDPDPDFSYQGLWEGDGGPADKASLSGPSGLAFGPDGSLYIAETWNWCIRKIDPAGMVSTVVGRSAPRGGRDDTPAAALRLENPADVAVDMAGNLYVVDGNSVFKVDPAGGVTTLAGTGKRGYSGDGGPANQAQLHDPRSVAVTGDGTVYIVDSINLLIRAVSPAGIITTVAGNGEPTFAGEGVPATEAVLHLPQGVAVGADGSIYISDTGNERLRKVDPNGVITTIAGIRHPGCWGDPEDEGVLTPDRIRFLGDGGPAANACLDYPVGLAVAADGTIYLVDMDQHRIRKIDAAGIITSITHGTREGFSGDGGPAAKAAFNWARDVALGPDGGVYIADSHNHRIRRIDPAGVITTVAGDGWRDQYHNGRFAGDGGPASRASLNDPCGLGFGPDGSLYIADTANHRIRTVDPGGVITTMAGTGEAGFSGDGGPAVAAALKMPEDVAVAANGTIYIADTGNHRIRKVDRNGVITTIAGTAQGEHSGDGGPAVAAALHQPCSLAIGPDGNLYITDRNSSRIRKVCLGP